jgi:hypothetical protein
LGDHLGFVEFCYNFTKHSTIGVRPFELALGVEVGQPVNSTIPRIGKERCKRGINVEDMVNKCKSQKNLEKT